MMKIIKIGIDFHGVINSNPSFFKIFIDMAISRHIEIHIISGGPKDIIEKYLKEYDINYTKLWCIYDYYEHSNQVDFFADGSFHIEDKLWNKAKAKYCEEENICLHIDDSKIYKRSFQTPYCLYDERNKICIINEEKLDFSKSPEKALDKIELFCKK